MDPWRSAYVCLIAVKQGFDCRSSGKNLAGKSWVSASVLACNSAVPLPLGNWHMSGIRHTGNQATFFQITKKIEQTVCYQIDAGIWDSGWILLIIFIQVLKWICFGRLLPFHIYLPWTFKWSSFTNRCDLDQVLLPLCFHFLLLSYLSQL